VSVADLVVLVAGAAAIAAVNLYFFGPGASRGAAPPEPAAPDGRAERSGRSDGDDGLAGG
jgi:hypothetical protein